MNLKSFYVSLTLVLAGIASASALKRPASLSERDEFRMKSSRSNQRRGRSAAYSMYFL
jgi:hypothetical protein